MDKKFINVLILGFAFMFIFTAFQTGGMIQKVVVDGIVAETTKDCNNLKSNGTSVDCQPYNSNGFISLCIIYLVFAFANWIAPSTVLIFGPKFSMVIGALAYILFISNFLYPVGWVLYLVSAIIGVGAAVIWTGQGNFLTINSTKETMSRNSGIFWALLQCSLLWGNLFVYFVLRKVDKQADVPIEKPTRTTIYIVLTSVCALGTGLLFLLRGGGRNDTPREHVTNPVQAIVEAGKLLITPKMLLLSVTFFYTGLELSFFSGVYNAALSYTLNIENAKEYAGISGMLIGVGEIVGGGLFGLLGSKTIRYGRDPIVILGYIVHMISFFLIFINLPADAPFEQTTAPAYITSSLGVALLCSFFLGFADSCFNTQCYSILGSLYSGDSAPAFALFKFTQSLGATVAFFYASVWNLHIQMIILAIFASLGTISFCTVEWQAQAQAPVEDAESSSDRHDKDY